MTQHQLATVDFHGNPLTVITTLQITPCSRILTTGAQNTSNSGQYAPTARIFYVHRFCSMGESAANTTPVCREYARRLFAVLSSRPPRLKNGFKSLKQEQNHV